MKHRERKHCKCSPAEGCVRSWGDVAVFFVRYGLLGVPVFFGLVLWSGLNFPPIVDQGILGVVLYFAYKWGPFQISKFFSRVARNLKKFEGNHFYNLVSRYEQCAEYWHLMFVNGLGGRPSNRTASPPEGHFTPPSGNQHVRKGGDGG